MTVHEKHERHEAAGGFLGAGSEGALFIRAFREIRGRRGTADFTDGTDISRRAFS
jgi:hypothetical protein